MSVTAQESSSVNDLIARLERATGPHRGIDAAIQKHFPADDAKEAAFLNGRDYPDLFTSSIDAALTLVPEGFTRAVDATVPEAGIRVDLHGKNCNNYFGDHKSEPIATCIAALRARAAGDQQ